MEGLAAGLGETVDISVAEPAAPVQPSIQHEQLTSPGGQWYKETAARQMQSTSGGWIYMRMKLRYQQSGGCEGEEVSVCMHDNVFYKKDCSLELCLPRFVYTVYTPY